MPVTNHTDSVGRSTYREADYGNDRTTAIRTETDLAGRYSTIIDQLQREAATGYINMLARSIFGESAEKGEKWIFQDVLGRVVKIWDQDSREFRSTYDALNRPVSSFVQEDDQGEICFNHIVYGEDHPDAQSLNLIGKPYQVYDQAGVMTINRADFKGNVLEVGRRLCREYKNAVNWQTLTGLSDITAIADAAEPQLEDETFSGTSSYDALDRPVEVVLPDDTILHPNYNEANYLDSLEAQIRGEGPFVSFLENQEYDAKGQLQSARYGNGTLTKYLYDPKTFRLTNMLTTKREDGGAGQPLQNLKYTYDPVGNITQVRDEAQQTHYFQNTVVDPQRTYEYNALYQLTRATGREHAGLGGNIQRNHQDIPAMSPLPHANDSTAVRTYHEEYEYDDAGNITELRHRTSDGNGDWTRRYRYAYQNDPADRTNRLMSNSLPGDASSGPYSARYSYDRHGNMTNMPHLQRLDWNFQDQLRHVDLGGGGNAWYVYSSSGTRRRKVIERPGGQRIERIYLGAVEIYRERQGTGDPRLERWTVHIGGSHGRIAQVDTKTIDLDNSDPSNPLDIPLTRYQYTDHLGSAVLETNEEAAVISYEEYHPFGTTAYRSSDSATDVSLKRYRFSGKERDDETGLYYYGARYYADWLGRWTSSDPAGFVDGLNTFTYCKNNPIMLHDSTGMDIGTVAATEENKYLLDPSQREAAEAYFEGVYTSRVRSARPDLSNQRVDITEMHFDENKGYWVIDDLRLVPDEQANGGGSENAPENDDATQPNENAGEENNEESNTQREDANVRAARDSVTHAGPAVERGIWARSPRDRGFTLEHLYSDRWRDAYNAQGDNRPLYDVETDTHVKQIKTNAGTDASQLRSHSRTAIRDAAEAVDINASGTMAGKSPQGVVITPTDAPRSAGDEIRAGYDYVMANDSNINPNSTPPEHGRGLPGRAGRIGTGLTVAGVGLSAGSLVYDIANEDYEMAGGDAISTVGGSLELYAISSPGATVAGASAMSAGLAVGGIGIAVTSGISGYRSYQRGDYAGAAAGAVGVLAGIAITAGVIFGAPALIVGGLIAAAGVGLFHLGRWLFG